MRHSSRVIRSAPAIVAGLALAAAAALSLPDRPHAAALAWLAPAVDNSLGMRLALVPPGQFVAPPGGRYPLLALTEPIYMGVAEVTRQHYDVFIEATGGEAVARAAQLAGSPMLPATPRHPVGFVSWAQARAFTEWLSQREGRRYRLPTETEWAYACFAARTEGDGRMDDAAKVGNIADLSFQRHFPHLMRVARLDDGHPFAAPVASYRANQLGLHDMIGNVWEWVDAETPHDATRVARGGSFATAGDEAGCRARLQVLPNERYAGTGFRVVLEVEGGR